MVERTGVILNDPAPATANLPAPSPEIAELEFAILLDGVYRFTGYDFREYALTMLKRRVAERIRAEGVATITGLLERVLHDPAALARLLDALTSRPGVPFSDPAFFSTLRGKIVPWLRTFPTIRVWVVGNAADAYSVAIVLRECRLEGRSRIYTTKPTPGTLERAQSGELLPEVAAEASHLYREGGGELSFERYVEVRHEGLRFVAELREGIVFSKHHLPSDGSFNEFQLVVARGALSYYGPAMAYRAHRTIYQSTARLGVVAFGVNSAALGATPHANAFEPFPDAEGFLRRVR